jgi:hypothetical protein
VALVLETSGYSVDEAWLVHGAHDATISARARWIDMEFGGLLEAPPPP